MGVSSRLETPADGAKRQGNASANTAAEGPGSRLFWMLNPPSADRNQALALLSTARSERSA